MRKYSFIIALLPLLLVSCNTEKPSSPSVDSITSYVKSVAETAPVLQSGKLAGEDIDYVVTSQPVLFASQQKNKSLSVYADVAKEFGKKFSTDGFPQAGLFIKKSLDEDATKKASVESFLASFDTDMTDLVNGATKAVTSLTSYSSDVTVQASKFGFNANVLKNVQKTNGLAFLEKNKNPDSTGFAKFKDPLGIHITDTDLASYYSSKIPSETTEMSDLSFSLLTPQGAPSAAFTRYASSDNFVTGQPSDVQAAFAAGNKDFIVFDSVNGLKLAKKNGGNYLLVRMVTFGNLYLVSTGHDTNNKLDKDDKIVGYGEGLVPDLVFKAVYSA